MEKPVEKIAILHCRKSGTVCTGAACFRTFYDRKKSFAQYEGQTVELSAYFDCNGCEADKLADPGFTEKLERMGQEHVDKILIATCAVHKCPQLDKIKQALDRQHLAWEEGTH